MKKPEQSTLLKAGARQKQGRMRTKTLILLLLSGCAGGPAVFNQAQLPVPEVEPLLSFPAPGYTPAGALSIQRRGRMEGGLDGIRQYVAHACRFMRNEKPQAEKIRNSVISAWKLTGGLKGR